ncbi:MAG: DUF4476 domain-containing protein [Flavobacteriales bacterium]
MKHLSTFAFAALFSASFAQAQTSDLVFFTDDGTKFTLIIDGDVKNSAPATRVVATGIRTESPMVMIKFEDAGIPQLRKPGMFPLGMEYTIMITTNKKGERVLRPTGQASLGTAAASEPVKPKPATFQEDPAPAPATNTTGVTQTMSVGGVDQVTTTTVVEQTGDEMGTGENVNFNMGVNGVGINMNVGVTEGTNGTTGTSTTSHTTTTTTTTHTTSSNGTTGAMTMTPAEPVKPVSEPEVYHMPGYSGPIGCGWPMSESEFAEAKKSIESKGFEETKMTTAKQVGRDRCFTVDQVKGIMGVFGFEDTKLEFAKYAYDRTYDIGNYYRVNDAFGFDSSIEELNTYIQSR